MTRDRKPAGIGSFAPNQLVILNGVNSNLISRSLQNVLTNFLILRCVMEKGPMYGNLKYVQTIVLPSNTLRGIGGKIIVEKFSNNILDNGRRKQVLP